MSPNSNNESKKEAKPVRRDDLRLGSGVEPTKSLLADKRWIEELKNYREGRPTKYEQLLGPFFRDFAPYRAKLSPPYEEGEILVIKGRVWSYDDKSPLAATIDVWHTDSGGSYDNEVEVNSAGEQGFTNRARVRCDENGYYEFETILPGAYKRGGVQHAAHIHFCVMYAGYVTCVTQLLFSDDKYLAQDPYRESSVVIDLTEVERNGRKYKEGFFPIVLTLEN